MIRFKNRSEAGKQLATKLTHYKNTTQSIVLGLPRGGVVTAFEVAQVLNLPLDIVVPRKIGAPDNPELAIGAVTEDGSLLLDKDIVSLFHISKQYLDQAVAEEVKEAQRRLAAYRKKRPPLNLFNKTVIIVDDGVATGLTMLAAIKSVQKKGAAYIVVAIPITSTQALNKIQQLVDEVITLSIPKDFVAISVFYDQFEQTTDEEVMQLMNSCRKIA